MNAREAETLARELMAEFGLTADGWSFRFDRAVRRFGSCQRNASGTVRRITLSAALTRANDRATVERTLRHEIAHALAPMRAGHGPQWRAACAITGAPPERCYGAEVNAPAGTWTFTCAACGAEGSRVRRASVGAYHCRGAELRWSRA